VDTIISAEPGLTVEAYATRKGLDVAALARWGVVTVPNPYQETDPVPCVALTYRDLAGKLVRTKYRTPTGTCWDKQEGVPLILYGLWFLAKVPVDQPVLLVEGESDCHAAWTHGIMALGLPGNSTWRPEWAAPLKGRSIFVWREPTLPGKKYDAGKKMVELIAADLPDARVIHPSGVKDLAELHLLAGNGFSADLRAFMDAARPIREVVVPRSRKPEIRVWRAPIQRGSLDRDGLDVQKAKDVPLDHFLRRLGFDLTRRGHEWAMCCPFHEDRNPSLRINPAKGLWRCDPCDEGGDAITFMQKWRGLAFADAVRAVLT
jgi:CHC2 zinc finger